MSHIQEALAAGFGVAKDASLVAALDAGKSFCSDDFSRSRFITRLTELTRDRFMAEAASLVLDSITLNIEVERYADARQRHDRYDDVAYHVRVRVDGLPTAARTENPVFVLPDAFGGPSGGRGIRLASSHEYHAGGEIQMSVFGNGRELRRAHLINGEWRGAMYVDLTTSGADDNRAIGSVKAALARAIAPAIDPRVRCSIFRPKQYSDRASRVRLSLGPVARAKLSNSTLVFDLPQHAQRLFVAEKGFLFDINPPKVLRGKFVDGEWMGDLYSNGVSEAENKLPLDELRAILIRNVNTALGDA
ncbi:hypothetical protein [Paraburkholderia strydomiana]